MGRRHDLVGSVIRGGVSTSLVPPRDECESGPPRAVHHHPVAETSSGGEPEEHPEAATSPTP
jgi:hypothetical protein